MLSIYLDKRQLNGLNSLLGKNLLQLLMEGCGIILTEQPQVRSGRFFVLYFQDEHRNTILLKAAFDTPLFDLTESKKFNLKVKKTKNLKIDFRKYKCSLSFPKKFIINLIKIYYSVFEKGEGEPISFIQGISFQDELGNSVVFSQEDLPNSFEVRFNDRAFLEKISQGSESIFEIKADSDNNPKQELVNY